MEDTQREWERRYGRVAAVAAIVAALMVLVQTVIVQLVVLQDQPDTDRGTLLAIDKHSGGLIASAVCQVVSAFALMAVFWYLFRVTRARRPELPPALVFLIYAGPALYAIGNMLGALDRADVAHDFASGMPISGSAGEDRAEDLLKDTSPITVGFLAAGQLTVAIIFVMISLNALRVGILSKFIGYLGVIVGALLVLPLLPGGSIIIEVFWLGSLAYLFLGRWPGGRGPAWESGNADPWPTNAQKRLAAEEDSAPPEPETPARRSSRKRGRKRR